MNFRRALRFGIALIAFSSIGYANGITPGADSTAPSTTKIEDARPTLMAASSVGPNTSGTAAANNTPTLNASVESISSGSLALAGIGFIVIGLLFTPRRREESADNSSA